MDASTDNSWHDRPSLPPRVARSVGGLPAAVAEAEAARAGRPGRGRPHPPFLIGNFAGYTVETGNILGFWKDVHGREHYGEHRLFRVAFTGRDRVPVLEAFLARVAAEIGERSIYLETGEDAWLIYPDESD